MKNQVTRLAYSSKRVHQGTIKNRLLAFFSLLCICHQVHAQDPSFSQFFASPLTLNPALTGKFDGSVRVAGNYRDQWPSVNKAYITSTASIDLAVLQNKLPTNDRLGIGFMAMTDKTADGILTSNYFSFSTAYHKAVDEDGLQQIGVGFQGSYANKLLDGPRLRFLDGLQVDGTWLPSPTERENLTQVTTHYFDMNAGILYNGSFNGSNAVYLGASLYHLNQPKESFLGVDKVILPTRLTIHAGGYFPSSSKYTSWYVSALYNQQATASDWVMGGALEISAGSDENYPVNFYLGAWVRMNNVTDAVIPYIGLDYGSFNLGMTYDVNVSAFKVATQGRGGLEISLIYILKRSEGQSVQSVQCPRF
ncbi:MAG: PorP/SprF family type IX secretion system membrane protein [Bacteroidota bacterium]|nr:PorP/SprF family type IX secretion system membrane protein [Bacteroidota bacterium]